MFTDNQIITVFKVLRKSIMVRDRIDKVITIISKDESGDNIMFDVIDELYHLIENDILSGNPEFDTDDNLNFIEALAYLSEDELIKVYKAVRDDGSDYKSFEFTNVE